MDSDSADDWVITTKNTDLPSTSTYLPALNGTSHGQRIPPTVQQPSPVQTTPTPTPATAPPPVTFSRRNRHSSPSKNNSYKNRSEQQYYKSLPSPLPPPMFHQKKLASPTRLQQSSPSSSTPSWAHSTPLIAHRPKGNKNHHRHIQEEIPTTNSHDIPMTAAPLQFVELLISTYKNSDQFITMRDSGNTSYLFQPLADSLHLCDDPCTWVQKVLFELSDYFTTHRLQNRDLTPKFQRLLVQAICRGLEIYLETPMVQDSTVDSPTTQPQQCMPDLIEFSGDEEEADLIDLSFDDNDDNDDEDGDDDSNDDDSDDDDSDDEDDDDVVVLDLTIDPKEHSQQPSSDDLSSLTLNYSTNGTNTTTHGEPTVPEKPQPQSPSQPQPQPQKQAQRPHPLTKKHQVAFVEMIREIEAPSIVYYGMEVFRATHLLMAGGEYESNGVLLSKQLLRQGFYNEAISCITRLHLQGSFPMTQLAELLFNVGQAAMLSVYTKDRPILQYSLLSFINVQLRYNFAGKLGVVDPERLQDVDKDSENIPPLQRMRERRFQKELLTIGLKLIEQLDLPEDRYYFLWLSQRYTAIRWIISSRSAQQSAENDYSINASSNYNGLLEMVAEDNPTLAKLVIKELVDLQDMVGAHHFSAILKQDTFFGFYQSLPPNQRMLGIIRGEQISHGLSSYHGKKRGNHANGGGDPDMYYKLPHQIRCMIVDDDCSLDQMKKSLMLAKRCGLDSEWVPTIAKSGKSRTALMQIATDDDKVYILDLKTLLKPSNKRLLDKAEDILRCIFESKVCMKLAYDFGGDLSMLGACMPGITKWKIHNFKDMNKVRYYNNSKLGNLVAGGLAGVVMTFLGLSMNKKQQISNWEKRPLTMEQITYAACDAYCLLEIHNILRNQGHPFSDEVATPTTKTIVPTFSIINSPVTSTTTTSTSSSIAKSPASHMGVQETPSSHSSPSTFDLIQF